MSDKDAWQGLTKRQTWVAQFIAVWIGVVLLLSFIFLFVATAKLALLIAKFAWNLIP